MGKLTEAQLAEIKAFVAERDTVLASGDVDAMIAFMEKHKPHIQTSRENAEVAMHKARTGAKSLPIAKRLESYLWLNARGLASMDDGDLSALAQQEAGDE